MKSFECEAQMLPLLLESLPELLSIEQTYVATPERTAGYRIVDLVVVTWEDGSLSDKIASQPPNLGGLSVVDLSVLAYLIVRKEATNDELTEELFLSSPKVTSERLDRLVERGLIALSGCHSYSPLEWINLLPTSTMAFELKLEKWPEALQQAKYASCFANQSYVVLADHAQSWITLNSPIFQREGVGVIVASAGAGMEVVIPASSHKGNEFERCLHRLRFLRDLVSGNGAWSIHNQGTVG